MSKTKNLNAWWGKTSWWVAGGVVFIIAVLAIVLFVNPEKKTDDAANGGAVATKTAASGCNVPVGDTSSKPAMPKDLRWAAAKGWTWPVSDTYGPTQTKDGYGTCFARSPLGAALAMTTFYGLGNTQDSKKVLDFYAINSAGKTMALSKPATTQSDTTGVGPITFAGFIADSFTPDEAQITLVFALAKSPTGYMGLPATLRWIDGDWKLKLLDDGSTFAGDATKPVAGQFTSWGGSHGM
jgi:hypothetical protein